MNKKYTLWIVVIVIAMVALPAFAGNGYREYSKSDFEKSGEEYRVYFFHASWCGLCKSADSELSAQMNRIPDNVVVYKTDFDSEKKLKKNYGVFSRHTYVLVDKSGNEITQWSGGGIDELMDKVQEHTQ
jgi:thiol-disulfide isomerase/thioredoxin